MPATIMQHPSSPPVGMTSTATLAGDLAKSLVVGQVEEALLALRVVDGRNARYAAELVVRLQDRDVFDAAVWRAAEALLLLQFGRDDRLRDQTLAVRSQYLTIAHRAITSFKATLEGLISPIQVQQAYADFATHRMELANARAEQLPAVPNAAGRQ